MSTKDALKGVATGLLTPVRFATTTGHFRSSLKRRAVDARGEPLPWFSYPAIYFLEQMDLSADRVVEFGGGQSTLYWSRRCRSVRTYETEATWAAELTAATEELQNVRVERCLDGPAMASAAKSDQADIIVVDNLGDRVTPAAAALDMMSDDGLIIFDNSDGFWSIDGSQTYPIIDMYNAAGLLRIDFNGYAPGTITPNTTSLYFRPGTKRLRDLPPPARSAR